MRVERRVAGSLAACAVVSLAGTGCGSGTAGIAGGVAGGGGGGGPGNSPPVAVLDFSIVLNPDERRGIPLAFTVIDAEGDDCSVLLQWRRPDEPFPDLAGLSAQQLEDLAADPSSDQARELQICSELTPTFGGRIGALPPGLDPKTSVRLPELASSAAQLLAEGLEGRVLEILRPSSRPEPLALSGSELGAPTGIAQAAAATNALVLEEAPGGWILREIDLATGAVVQDVASGGGVPGPLAAQGEQVAFVAAGSGTVWSVTRVDLQTSATQLVDVASSTMDGIRGISALNDASALVTVDDSLVRVRFPPGAAPSSATVLDGLDEPWGVAVDPLLPERAYVAERGADRVLEVDLGPRRVYPVPAAVAPGEGAVLGALPLPAPGAIALERAHRLLVATHPGGAGATSLRGLDLRRTTNETGGTVAEPFVEEIASLPGTASDLATGPDGLRLAALPGLGTLAAGGGVEQRRTIASDAPYSPLDQVVSLAPGEALDPVPPAGAPWRIRASTSGVYPSSSTGVLATYLWNAGGDVQGGGIVIVRSIAIDDDVGVETQISMRVLAGISFEPPPITVAGPGVIPIGGILGVGSGLVADLDGDGDLDLAICYEHSSDHGQGGASVFLQRPGLAFEEAPGSPLLPPTPSETLGIAAGDLDGDGRLDLVLANNGGPFTSTPNDIAVYLQGPGGGFGPPAFLGVAPSAGTQKVTCADLDMDGDLDIVTTHRENGDGAVVVWRQTAALDFVPEAPIELGVPGQSWPRGIAAADLDGDGDVDLVVADEVANALWILDQDELGGFSVLDPLNAPARPFGGPRDVVAVDLDRDGDLDLAAATAWISTTSSDGVLLFEQIQPSQFVLQQELGGAFVTASPRSIAAGDLDGDGDFDLVVANYYGQDVSPFYQVSSLTSPSLPIEFVFDTTTNPETSVFGSSATISVDVDGDGDLDVVVANTEVEGIQLDVFENIGPGRYSVDGPPVGGPATTFGVWAVDVGDIDGDGDMDIASANLFGDDFSVLLQATPGVFGADPAGPYGKGDLPNPRAVRLADVNGDERLDLLGASQSGGFGVFLGAGPELPGLFPASPSQSLLPPGLQRSLDVGDFDGDGLLDLVGTCTSCVVVYRNTGDPGLPFDPDPVFLDEAGFPEVTLNPRHVLAADLDADGLDDLVVCNAGMPGNVVIFRSLGGEAFEVMGTPFHLDGSPSQSAAGDLDGDGDLDIVVSIGLFPALAAVFFQEGGAFSPSPQNPLSDPSLSSGQNGLSVAVADLDGDGDLDFAVRVDDFFAESPYSISLFLQGRPGLFAADPRGPIPIADDSLPPFNSQSLRIADIDGDGDLDIVAANKPASSISIVYGVH